MSKNPNLSNPHVPASDLSAAIREIAGPAASEATAASLGPGITYLLEIPNYRPTFYSRNDGVFSKAFYKLLESLESWEELVAEDDKAAYRDATSIENFQTEARYHILINRRGETLPIVDFREIIYDAAQRPIAIAGRIADDSFRSVALNSLSRRSWNEIAATMTRRFLHDFNNTIAGIYSLSELYAEPGSDPKSTAEAMGHIRDCAVRAQDLTRKIRYLTSLEAGQESYFDLGKLLEEQQEFMEALLPKGSEIHFQIEPGEHPIRIDAIAFRQAILHLTSNACDACGEDAKIEIELATSEQNGQRLAEIEFRDNGSGFKPAELEQATTPFYSTKNSPKHPGLGLSIVSNFAKEQGGHLQLANREQGGIVRIAIPLLKHEPSTPAKPTDKKKSPPPEKAASEAKPSNPRPPKILIYTWEDITRHPLLLAMQTAGWDTRIHLDPGELLIDLSIEKDQLDGVLVFKSALDEKAEPLISELGQARDCDKVALIALGENVEGLSVSTKRNCGLIASGASKPSALLNKLVAYFS
ncbi:ATPase, histidine kinase-, DNA gyrase B-, and HSP90-like domain protein [Verrucomicrobiia bacterium DG1235]|nr:ATPase, histidine kinase-, DNA gyrase B-, and HSP90-like domain protein [Verrucomicrobiae bacterium DG1235]